MSKKETIEEFLARGGQITKCAAAPLPNEEESRINPTSATSSTMMTLGEGALYYAESRAKPKERKKKEDVLINFAALPASLLKYIPKKN
jgi:hypothetical protein